MKINKLGQRLFFLLLLTWLISSGQAFAHEERKHEFGEYQIEQEADCAHEGLKYRECTGCKKKEYEVIPYQETHHFGEWTTIQERTCTESGIRRRACERCGHAEEEENAPTGEHDFEETKYPATCTEDGRLASVCRQCGLEKTEVIPAASGHEYEEEIHPATCTEDGEIIYSCKNCGDTYVEKIAATGHKYGERIVKKEADADSEGVVWQICEYDPAHVIEERIPAIQREKVSMIEAAPVKKGLFNQMDIIISGMNAGTICLFIILIQRDRYIINWDNKKRELYRKRREEA